MAVTVAGPVTAGTAWANPASAALRARGSTELYSLEPGRAAATFRDAIAADPEDPAAYRALAGALWIAIAFDRGTMTVDSYLGRVSRDDVRLPPPPAALSEEFHRSLDKALALARAKLSAQPRDPDASFELGAAIGLRASYMATIEGGVLGAFKAAKQAFDAHERVLALSPARHDAGLIVGVYRYLIADLSMPLRWMAYAAGFGGGREKGLQLIQRAAEYEGDNQADARLALLLLYNREQRFDEALAQLEALRRRYPLNRLLWLETGATLLRAGRHAAAVQVLSEGISKLVTDSRTLMFGEEALWYYKRGAALAELGRADQARADLSTALGKPGRDWVHGRAHFELGRIESRSGRRDAARGHLESAIRLGDSDRDGASADAARRLLK
ncbi:MAG: tetratricopeptide repeat protein [Luteitalea sp.]|nr:tetratricopeptide repeat protein [Luteitalea sp.]